ncbi:unnamed protein product [Coffea canephora]|uniref:Uncharacterized protein n=1 Tax=Coffea canephora TaxID=49390 RepID=A0A068V185_COFCA|nr:unnamed protein product [Coffea canephora]
MVTVGFSHPTVHDSGKSAHHNDKWEYQRNSLPSSVVVGPPRELNWTEFWIIHDFWAEGYGFCFL